MSTLLGGFMYLRILSICILLFSISCGSNDSTQESQATEPDINTDTNNKSNQNNIKQIPAGYFQGECKNTTNGVGSDVREARVIDPTNKKFIRVLYTYLSKNSTCTGNFLEEQFYFNYDNMFFELNTNYFKAYMRFDKAVATFINSELDYEEVNSLLFYGRNNWEYNVPQDVTHTDILGDYWIEPSGYYTLYFLSNDNILNENLGDHHYENTVDTNKPFYRKEI